MARTSRMQDLFADPDEVRAYMNGYREDFQAQTEMELGTATKKQGVA